MVTLYDWLTLPEPAKSEILGTLRGGRLMWCVNGAGCTRNDIGPPGRDIVSGTETTVQRKSVYQIRWPS